MGGTNWLYIYMYVCMYMSVHVCLYIYCVCKFDDIYIYISKPYAQLNANVNI